MRHLITQFFLAAAASALSTAPAQADLGDQLAKLLADDGAMDDEFGARVAMCGKTAIIGTRDDSDNGSGSAYLFDISDPANPTQLFKLEPSDGADDDFFGREVAISCATAIVGAYGDDDNGSKSGSAYLFDISDPANPTQLFKLEPSDGAEDDLFGISVAISGATAIVGADGDDDNGSNSGSAYLFDTTTGQQLFKILPDDGATGDHFGGHVAISGATVIVSATSDDDNGEASGSVYLFDISDPANPRQIFKLLADDGAAHDIFGVSVAISGATAIVGAYSDDDNGDASGSAYLFDTTTGQQLFKILPDDGAAGDRFGGAVAINGATAIVGAALDDDNGSVSGSAYLFDATTGEQLLKLLPNDGAAEDHFGISVAISGAIAMIGADHNDDNGADSGSAYLFDAAAPGTCPWDLDGDTTVGTGDLIVLLGSWGDPYGTPDLILLLGNWGECPK